MYSQNEEEKYITAFFDGFTGELCSIGENDGLTFSNARRLIELGWAADLIEPSQVCYDKLLILYEDEMNVSVDKVAIGTETGRMTFHESGFLIGNGDKSLVSTLVEKEKDRWGPGMYWDKYEVPVYTWADWQRMHGECDYDFITIDAEGLDLAILLQIDLTYTKLLCIEHNSIPETRAEMIEYCAQFGMTKILYENGENLLICRP